MRYVCNERGLISIIDRHDNRIMRKRVNSSTLSCRLISCNGEFVIDYYLIFQNDVINDRYLCSAKISVAGITYLVTQINCCHISKLVNIDIFPANPSRI